MRGPIAGFTAWIVLVILLGGTMPGNAQEGEPAPGEARVLLVLHTTRGPHGEPPHLSHSLVFNTTVTGDAEHREVRASLPAGAYLEAFNTYKNGPRQSETLIDEGEGTRWAIAQWGRGGPLPGSDLAMRLDARQNISTGEEIHITWSQLPSLEIVRIYLPSSYTPVVDPDYEVRREQPKGGLVGWNLTNPPAGNLTLQFHPVETGPDPSLAAPPPPWAAYVVIFALVLVSGGLWFLGKKVDARKSDKKREP